MNTYFTNPSLSCQLTGGQEILPNVVLNATTYDQVRNFSFYASAVVPNRINSISFFSPQDNMMVWSSRVPYNNGSSVFYQNKDVLPSCRKSLGQDSPKPYYSSEQVRSASQDSKTTQIYPWMQRMNSHSGVGHGSDRRKGRQI